MQDYWQHFVAGVVVTVVFPMLPLIVEWRYAGSISVASVYIAAIMYVSAIALSYESVAVFYCGVVGALFLGADYGRLFTVTDEITPDAIAPDAVIPALMICGFGIMQLVKCFDLHVNQKENFIYFPKVSK